MTIGDVLALIGAIALTLVAWGSMILLIVLLFPARTAAAQQAAVIHPWLCFFRGLGITVLLVFLAAAEIQSAAGPVRLVGGTIAGFAGLLCAIGSAGLVRLCASRIENGGKPGIEAQSVDQTIPYSSLLKATAIYVGSGLLPVIGWLFLTPVLLILSVGAGAGVVLPARRAVKLTAPQPVLEATR